MKTLEQIARDSKLRVSQVRGAVTATTTQPSAIKGAPLYDAHAESRIVAAARAARDAAQTADVIAADAKAQKTLPTCIREIERNLETAIAKHPGDRVSVALAEDLYSAQTGRALADDITHVADNSPYKSDRNAMGRDQMGNHLCRFTMNAANANGKQFGTGRG
ncbi:MAG: hypothetical protein AAGA29_04955 [Planctomycetota bacterium]